MTEKYTCEELEQRVKELETEVIAGDLLEEEYERVFNFSLDMIGSGNLDGSFTKISSSFGEILGYTEKEFLSKPFLSFVHQEDVKKTAEALDDAIKGKRTTFIENRYKCKDGSYKWIEWKVRTLLKENKFITVGRDITARKQTEKELKDHRKHLKELVAEQTKDLQKVNEELLTEISERIQADQKFEFERAQLLSIFDSIDGEVYVSDIATYEILYVTQTSKDAFQKELIGGTCYRELQRLDSPCEFCTNDIILKQKPAPHRWEYHNPILDKDYAITDRIIKWPDGRDVRLEIALDITERKQAEKALQESEEQLRAVFIAAENVSFIIATIADEQNHDPKIIEFSPGAEKIFGYKRDEMLGKSVSILHSPESARVSDMSRDMRDGKMGFSGETTLVRKSGEEFPALLSTHPLVDKEGKMYAAFGVSVDISNQKQLEAQLRQTQKIESLGTLAGGIAHEFNNIIGIILGNTELAISDVPEENRVYKNLEEVRVASLRARDVVRQLLAFSRKTIEDFKPLRLTPIVKDTLKLIRSSIPSTIKIRQDISAESDTINADPTQINQVIINLCTNASHAMQDQIGTLEISLDNIELGEDDLVDYQDLSVGNYVRLTMTDTGYGMTPEIRERIFDPFFTTKEVGQGTGMGLSVVHGIVKDHRGDIIAHSEPGKGSTFHILFPIVNGILEPDGKPSEPTPCGTERILFVDDEKAIAFAAKHNFEDLNYTVVTDTDPIHALKIFKEEPQKFDLLITDTTMPGMTGDRLAKEIMKIRSDIPVILCTGYSEHISKEKAQEMGIKAFVMKPIVKHEMGKTIRQVLDAVNEKKAPPAAKRVLVVDDNAQMRSIIRQMLESTGFEVSEAPDGNVALWIAKEKPADLIITDLIMPEKEGLETITELKCNFPDVKIIAISGGGKGDGNQYLNMAKIMGADITLAKPFEKEELLKRVNDLLG